MDAYVRMGLEAFTAAATKTIQDLSDEEVSGMGTEMYSGTLPCREESLRRSLRQAEEDLKAALERVSELERELTKLRREYANSYQLYQKRLLRG